MTFQILCVTMEQKDFSKIDTMNIKSDVIFANQAQRTSYSEIKFCGNHVAKMITTNTRGVGINRNVALMYANADICLLADDDVFYHDDVEKVVLKEFKENPKADVIVFHLDSTDPRRTLNKYKYTRRRGRFEKRPWGAVRIAFKLESIKRGNIWFTTLFGGGCTFANGEDSMWIDEVFRKKLKVYVSKETIGTVSMDTSSWFTGFNEKYYYSKGAFYEASYRKTVFVWMLYFVLRTHKQSELSLRERIMWMQRGRKGYKQMRSFDLYKEDAKNYRFKI